MKTFLLTLICLTTLVSWAQTAIIAHKSHSGTAADFFIDPSGNFGDPQPIPQLLQVIRLNDSTYVNVYLDSYSAYIYHDTIHSAVIVNYHLNIDSLKKGDYYSKEVEFINFKHSPKDLKPKTPGYQIREAKSEKIIQNETLIEQPTPKKKKKSYLLFLFGITGGGMLLMRLFSRILTPQVIS